MGMIVVQKFRFLVLIAASGVLLLIFYYSNLHSYSHGFKDLQQSFPHRFREYILHHPDKHRYVSSDPWRPPESYEPTYVKSDKRPKLPSANKFRSKGEYLKQPIISDYPPGADKVFLMIKTGATVLWERLPIHLLTTLTKVPKFGLYSDSPGSIAGYEVVDALANISQSTKSDKSFQMYKYQRIIHDEHGVNDAGSVAMNEGWELDKFKNIPMLAHAYAASPESDWFVFMDADSYMLMDNLMDLLNTMDPDEPVYYGAKNHIQGVGSDGVRIAAEFAHGGSGVIISRKALELTVGQHPEYVKEYENRTSGFCCGDGMVGMMLKEKLDLGISDEKKPPHVGVSVQGEPYYSVKVNQDKWCAPIVTFHKMTPHDIEVMYEYERLRPPNDRNITYGDIYRDFYLPYISDKVEDWDNRANERRYSLEQDKEDKILPHSEGGPEERPYESFEACRRKCESQDDCMSFRLIADKNFCGLSWDIRLGKPTTDWIDQGSDSKLYTKGTTSGWMIDRIRELRKTMPCDPLYHDPNADGELGEGWYRIEQDHLSGSLQ
jgi:hypothetical protein